MATKATNNDQTPSLADVMLSTRVQKTKNGFLEQINKCVDWRPIEQLLRKKYTKTANASGNSAYDPLLMFKILLLGMWYDLSDRELEYRVNDSLSFSRFLSLDVTIPSPDHSTICRFRNELVRLNLYEKILKLLNKQLTKHGIMDVKQGAIVDATVVESPRKPDGRKTIVIASDREDTRTEEEKEAEEQYQVDLVDTKPGVDAEARWVYKNGFKYGYKGHILTDQNGLVLGLMTTPANTSDTVMFKPLLEKYGIEDSLVYADKGYTSKSNDQFLKEHNCVSGIMLKATRGKKLTEQGKALNRMISRVRWVIERTNGSLKAWCGCGQCRYVGLAKTHAQMLLGSIAYNMKRLPRLLMRQTVQTC